MPAENLLGEVGKGHKIAFNVLNFARFKLGAMCGGGGAAARSARRRATRRSASSSASRSRSFGAIKHKLGEMIVRTYAVESLVYRTAGMIDARIAATPHDAADQSAALATLEEYAIEASIAKVAGSEMLNYVLDENIQIHGGNGYVRDYPAERHYRDSRVNRIFEGTNEINRLLIPGMLARRAVKGDIGIIAAARALQEELLGPPSAPATDDGVLSAETRAVEAYKKAALMAFGIALQTLRPEVERRAGSVDARGGHVDGSVCRRQRRPARGRRRAGEVSEGIAACRRGTRAGQRCSAPHRGIRTPGARSHGRRRHTAHHAGGASASIQGDAGQHGCASPPDRGSGARARGYPF